VAVLVASMENSGCEGLGCVEVDELVTMIATLGAREAAALVLVAHCAMEDGPGGDQHGQIADERARERRLGVPVSDGKAIHAAAAYVDGMVGSLLDTVRGA
jgi:hypothetical protein